MAQLICRLPSDHLPPLEQARAAGISGWLVEVVVQPSGLLALNTPVSWLNAPDQTLPFCLEWQTPQPLTPGQETRAAKQLKPWLAHPHHLRWRGQTPLWIQSPEQLSHLQLASRRLLLLLGAQAALWGGGSLGQQLDGRYERPERDLRCRPVNGLQRNYDSFLYHAHHRLTPTAKTANGAAVVIPTVLPLNCEQEALYSNAGAASYREWLAQAQAWADLWHGQGDEALVLVDQWPGHHRWFCPASPATPQLETVQAAPRPSGHSTGWGAIDPTQPALLVHGYHLDLLDDLLGELLLGLNQQQQPVPSLYVSTPEAQRQAVEALLKGQGWPSGEIVGVANRGRDVAPFVGELLPRALAQGHPWIIKLHTKRSSHLANGRAWGNHLQQQLATAEALHTLGCCFAEQPQLGLVAPAGTLLPSSISLHHNASHLQQLLPRLGISGRWLLQQSFVAGSMFAARPEALAPLCQLQLPLDGFEPEQQQRDGTLAHALERLMAAVAIRRGWQVQERTGSCGGVPHFGLGWAALLP